jgi:hypothetical protein
MRAIQRFGKQLQRLRTRSRAGNDPISLLRPDMILRDWTGMMAQNGCLSKP